MDTIANPEGMQEDTLSKEKCLAPYFDHPRTALLQIPPIPTAPVRSI